MTDNSDPNHSYQQYHKTLLAQLTHIIKQTPPFNGDELDELQEKFIQALEQIALPSELTPSAETNPETVSPKTVSPETPSSETISPIESGQSIICTIVANYPHITPSVPRDLFWYFGGDCLHYLDDSEISFFQQLDERYHDSLSASEGVCNYEQLVAQMKAPKA